MTPTRPALLLLLLTVACEGRSQGLGIIGPIGGDSPTSANIAIVSGNNQTAPPGSPLPDFFVVRVTDSAGNDLRGVGVDWAVTLGGGTLLSSATTTDTAGLAENRLTLGTGVSQSVTATVRSDQSLSVTFSATAADIGAAASVTVGDSTFTPAAVQVLAGGVVTWTWPDGSVTHNVTWVTANLPDSGDRSSGTFQVTFGAPGTFNYYCSIHGTPTSGMRGSVTVN
jgi:plastocyanin